MPQARTTFPAAITKPVSVLAHIGFSLTGIITTMLGPLLPSLKAHWELTDAQAGYLFTAQFATSVVGTVFLTKIARRIGFLPMLAFSYLLMAIGVAGVGANSWGVGLVSVSAYGFALGISMPATNLLISETSGGRRAAVLNILNFIWCIGAVACPLLVPLVVHNNIVSVPMWTLGAILAMVGLWLWRSGVQSDAQNAALAAKSYEQAAATTVAVERGPVVLTQDQSPAKAEASKRVWQTGFAYVLAALIFLYVGTESCISGWIGAYTKRANAEMAAFYSLPQALFWTMLMIGRLLAPVWLRRLTEERLVLITLSVALVGISLLLATAATFGLLGGALLSGAGLAAIYPTTIAMFMKHFGDRARASAAPLFAMGGLGGAVIPPLVGVVSDWFANLRAGLFVPFVVNVVMIVLQVFILAIAVRQSRRVQRRA